MRNFNYKITERIAILSQSENGGRTLELNRISYNGREARIDLRRWGHNDGEHFMQKGVTLTEEEAAELQAALGRIALG